MSLKQKAKTIMTRAAGAGNTEKLKALARDWKQRRIQARWRTDRHDLARLKKRVENGRGPWLLHFGACPRVLKGWINLDLIYIPSEAKLYPKEEHGGREDVYIVDFTEVGLPFPDNSVDAVFHEDFLEHLNQRDAIVFLAETLRVMKPGAVHRVSTPELTWCMRDSDFAKGKAGVFVREWDKYEHLNIFTRAYLTEMAKMIGYSRVEFTPKNGSSSKFIPREYRPLTNEPDRYRPEEGQIICDLIK